RSLSSGSRGKSRTGNKRVLGFSRTPENLQNRENPGLLLSLVLIVDLRADFTSWKIRRVHVGVRHPGSDRGHQLVELACRDALRRRPNYVARDDCAGDHGGSRRPSRACGLSAATAEEHRDTARREPIAEMNVRD